MADRTHITGLRPPSYVSKATLAAELDMSESTIDSYVQRGILPKPCKRGGSVRWRWADVDASFNPEMVGDEDEFMKGVGNV